MVGYYIFKGLDPDLSQDEQEEKASRIAQVLELQNTLDGNFYNALQFSRRINF
jgi:hypothetical protein